MTKKRKKNERKRYDRQDIRYRHKHMRGKVEDRILDLKGEEKIIEMKTIIKK
jgi:hypothetical protein